MSVTRTGILAASLVLCVMIAASVARAQSSGPSTPEPDTAPESAREVVPDPGALDVDVAETMPWSEGVSMDARRQARGIFLQANELALGRFFATAAAKYKEAVTLWPHPAFYYNLAVAQMSLDDPVSAYGSLDEALRHGAEPLGRDKHGEARQYRDLLGSQLARVMIRCDVPGAQVSLDGTPLFVGPGEHQAVMRPGGYYIEATKPGHIADSRQIILSAGRVSRYELVLQREEKERRFGTWVPWTVAGVGAAMIAAGGVFHWQAAGEFDEYDARFARLCEEGCSREELVGGPDRQEFDVIMAGLERAQSKRTLAEWSYGVGAAVVVTSGLLLYFNRDRTVLRQVGVEPGGVSLAPVIGLRGAGLYAGFRF